MTAVVVQGDARRLPLPDASVDLIVTSPPYWAIRSYTDGGEHYEGQIGSEPTPAEYVAALLDCTREWMRVLKSRGSIFVNLGDKYSDRGHGPNRGNGTGRGPQEATLLPQTRGPMEKSLLGLPWRYALGCIDDLGLILRAEIVWHKPNGLPDTASDRVPRVHEQMFHFTLQPRYFAAADDIREAYEPGYAARKVKYGNNPRVTSDWGPSTRNDRNDKGSMGFGGDKLNPLGRLPGSVWEIATVPLVVPEWLGVDHFAAFPPALVRRAVLGWSPATGTVLDPCGGTGTTAVVASVLGRRGVTIDRSADYCRVATWRTTDPAERARALGVPKPPPIPGGMEPLFT